MLFQQDLNHHKVIMWKVKEAEAAILQLKKVNNSKEDYIMHIINNVGKELTANEVDILISDFLSYDIINKKEARLLKVATSDNVLQLQKKI